jgi:drug/metabolite transporter (DMT)-like permease
VIDGERRLKGVRQLFIVAVHLVGVASMYLYTRAIALLGSVRASVSVALVPLVTAFASAPVLAEQPHASEVVGMVVVVLGVVLSLRS